ncbi:MAG: cardiolipin synthase [Lachnospiraceae bacterium]|nr:cardiolipin synthase [Lachnospiraceae bacterium]
MENKNERNKETTNKVLRLAKPVKKGLLHLIFSRTIIIVLLLLAQIMLMVSFYSWLNEYLPHFSACMTVFNIVMVIVLFNMEMDAEAKLTWMLIIAVLPIFGAALLLFTRVNAGHRQVKKSVEDEIDRTRKMIPQPAGTADALREGGSGLDDLSRYLNRSGCFPVFENEESRYFPSGEAYFEGVLEELSKAEEYIYLEFFIIEEGEMWGRILEILKEKADAGLDVRVMYDGMCELNSLPKNYLKLLRRAGITAKAFSPIMPVISSHYNYRDHRKILVIDGKTAFTGGVNLADEYINVKERFGHWKDAGLMVRGAAARSFTLMFLQMWNITEREADYSRVTENMPQPVPENTVVRAKWSPERKMASEGGYVMPYADCPLDNDKVGETVYMDILYRANDYVHIMTPYLILDGELKAALKYAAERGVDVKLILPGIPDKKAAYALAKSHYKELVASGIEIYEYTPGFVHSKIFVSDDKKAVVGTINLDYRSLYHHFECAAYLYKTPCVAEVEADFCETLTKCRRVTPETIRKEKLSYKITGWILKFTAPLM